MRDYLKLLRHMLQIDGELKTPIVEGRRSRHWI